MLNVSDFLQSHSLDDLNRQYAISFKRHSRHPNLVLLQYDQQRSPMREKIVQECRGLILDEALRWRIVCYPYNKFFNYGEENAAPIDWRTAKVYEKLDGSLMVLYWYHDNWWVSSVGAPEADGRLRRGMTYNKLFDRVRLQLDYPLPKERHYCYMFELMTPYNRIIVHHRKSRLVLHGVRNIETLQELEPQPIAARYGWECVTTYPLNELNAVLGAAQAIDPTVQEGYVVCDANFNRVKVKSPQYVALVHKIGTVSSDKLLEAVRSREGDELISYFPEWAIAYTNLLAKYENLCAEISEYYSTIQNIAEQKAFAMEAQKKTYSSVLFALRNGKAQSVRAFLTSVNIRTLGKMLDVKWQDLGF